MWTAAVVEPGMSEDANRRAWNAEAPEPLGDACVLVHHLTRRYIPTGPSGLKLHRAVELLEVASPTPAITEQDARSAQL